MLRLLLLSRVFIGGGGGSVKCLDCTVCIVRLMKAEGETRGVITTSPRDRFSSPGLQQAQMACDGKSQMPLISVWIKLILTNAVMLREVILWLGCGVSEVCALMFQAAGCGSSVVSVVLQLKGAHRFYCFCFDEVQHRNWAN